jgi:hypothetical protein
MTGEELCPVEHLGLVISGRTAVLVSILTSCCRLGRGRACFPIRLPPAPVSFMITR